MNIFIIRIVQAICLSLLLYWGNGYKLDYVFYLGSFMFFAFLILIGWLQFTQSKSSTHQRGKA